MSDTPSPEHQLALTEQKRPRLISTDESAASTILDTAKFEQMSRVANVMALTPVLPKHLAGFKDGDQWQWYSPEEIKATCFLIVNQAVRWNMDPFSLMGETYVVGGKLAYQGKMVAAVVNARAALKTKLDYKFTGTKGTPEYTCTVSATLEGEETPRESSLAYKDAKTSNSMWTKDPEQKLAYSAVVRWARRYCPEVVLGVLTDDDLERIAQTERDITPAKQTAQERLRLKLAQNAVEETKDAPESISEANTALPDDPPPFTDAEVLPPEQQSQEPADEVDEVLTDFLLAVADMTEAGELLKAREQSVDFDTLEKQETAKNAILKRAHSLGLKWDKKAGTFISEG